MNRKKDLETILTLVTALLVFYLIFKLRFLVIFALVIGLTGIFSEFLSNKISYIWLKFAEITGKITSRILLTLIYYCILTPVAFLSNLFNKDKMNFKRSTNTYWVKREKVFIPEDFENVW
jgi:hypothetical protein